MSESIQQVQTNPGGGTGAPPAHRPRVLIVGGGFAGLHAAKWLAHLPVDVTVVDRRNHHTFQPLLYQVAMAVLSPADIAQPIRTILRHERNAQVLMDEVVRIDVSARQVTLAAAHGSTTTTSFSPPAPPTPTSATTSGSRSPRGSSPSKTLSRSAAACFSPSSSPSARCSTRAGTSAQFRRHRRRPHGRGTRRRHQRHRPALHAPRLPAHRPRQEPRAPARRFTPRAGRLS